jgi:tripartite-type tricarboxylate transporter receptor subunit TctC
VLTALRAGEVDVAFEILGPMLGQVGAHAVRVLAVTSDRRDAALPDVPTVLESGVSGYSVASWNALAAPSATPAPVIERLNRAAAEALGQPAVRQSLQELGVRAQPSSPKVLQDLLASEIHRWGDVIRAAKIEPS